MRFDFDEILRAENVDAAPRCAVATVDLENALVQIDQAPLSTDAPFVRPRGIAADEDAEVVERGHVLAQNVTREQFERLEDIVEPTRIEVDEAHRAIGDLLVL